MMKNLTGRRILTCIVSHLVSVIVSGEVVTGRLALIGGLVTTVAAALVAACT